MVKALVAYGTRYGATAGNADEIAKVLHSEGIDARLVNLKEEKEVDISAYDLIVVGSGIMLGKWTGEAEGFLSRHKGELQSKKLALFVSSSGQTTRTGDVETDEVKGMRVKYIDDIATKYGLNPVSTGLFGGVLDFSKWPWWMKIAPASKQIIEESRVKLVKAGIKEMAPGVYDTRNWDTLRGWARELAHRVQKA